MKKTLNAVIGAIVLLVAVLMVVARLLVMEQNEMGYILLVGFMLGVIFMALVGAAVFWAAEAEASYVSSDTDEEYRPVIESSGESYGTIGGGD